MKKELPLDEDLRVTLKPIFGIKPGIYLLVLYSLVLAAAAFWLFLEPGIHRPGSLVTFLSDPPGAAVFTRDARGTERYWGPTPVSSFLPEGEYTLEFRKNHFKTHVQDLSVGNRLFFSRFFPETQKISTGMEGGDLEGIKTSFDRDLSDWAMLGPSMGEYAYPSLFSTIRSQESWVGVSHPLPPLFTQLREDWRAAGAPESDLKNFLIRRLAWVADPVLYRNLSAALGQNWGDTSFSAQWAFWKAAAPDFQGLATWILVNQPYKERSALLANREFLKAMEEEKILPSESKRPIPAPGARVISGMEFLGVPGGSFTFGTKEGLSIEPPFQGSRVVEVEPFLLGRLEVTNRDYARFVQARPQWAPDQKDQLIAASLVDRNYLAHWNGNRPATGDDSKPVTGVSWHAAVAFAAWVEEQNPGLTVSLPLEEEWEWAALDAGTASAWSGENLIRNLKEASEGTVSGLGFRGLSGQAWEWTRSDAALAAPFLSPDRSPLEPLGASLKKTLRGGSYANPRILAQQVRGFYKADWCTPYAGFRLMAREK